MGIMDRVNAVVSGGSGNTEASVQLTTTGEDKLTTLQAGGAEFQVLSAVKRHEPCTVTEVSRDAQMQKYTYAQIRDKINQLIDRGWLVIAPIGRNK